MLQATRLSPDGAEQLTPDRVSRDAYWDNLFELVKPLTPENAGDVATGEGSTYNAEPGLPQYPNRVLLIAKFGDHRSIFSTAKRCVYTEITFTAQEVFERSDTTLISGDQFILTMPGGTVALADGKLISFLTHPKSYSLRPGRTYLLALKFEKDGNFYLLNESWDVTDGTVRANSGLEAARAQQHTSGVVGLTREQLEDALRKTHS